MRLTKDKHWGQSPSLLSWVTGVLLMPGNYDSPTTSEVNHPFGLAYYLHGRSAFKTVGQRLKFAPTVSTLSVRICLFKHFSARGTDLIRKNFPYLFKLSSHCLFIYQLTNPLHNYKLDKQNLWSLIGMLTNVFFTPSYIVCIHVCTLCAHGFVHFYACECKHKCATTSLLKSKDKLGYDSYLPTCLSLLFCSCMSQARWPMSVPMSSCHHLSFYCRSDGITHACYCAWLWVLETWTRLLMFARQALYTLSYLPSV